MQLLNELQLIYVGVENNDVTDVKDAFGYQWSMYNAEVAGFYDQATFRILNDGGFQVRI